MTKRGTQPQREENERKGDRGQKEKTKRWDKVVWRRKKEGKKTKKQRCVGADKREKGREMYVIELNFEF